MSTKINIENLPFKAASLSDVALAVIKHKGTEYPFTGEYNDKDEAGTYLCRLCGLGLYRAQHKFHSGCGWPSFDEELPTAVLRFDDPDGKRTEIVCRRCHAHLGLSCCNAGACSECVLAGRKISSRLL